MLAQLVRLGVKSLHLYFQFFPLWWSLVMTGVIYEGVREVTRSRRVAGWTTLVFLLASDGAFWLTFFFPHGQGWDMASLDNGTDQFFNPPYVMAKVIFILAWVTLNHFWQTRHKRVLALLVGLLIPLTLFKVYWSVLFASGWCLVWLARAGRSWWRRGRMSSLWSELVAIVVVGIGSGLLLASATTGQAAKMAFVPFLWPKLLVSSEHLGWDEWALRQQVYQQVPSWKRQTWDYVLLTLVALIYVFGARLVGGWTSRQTRRYLSGRNYVFLVVPAVGWTFVGFNFLQGVGNYNSFNFLIIAAVALLIPLGVNCHVWWRTIGGKIFVIALLASFLPRLAYNWSEYLGQSLDGHGRVVNCSELELLANLQKYTTWDDILLVNPDNDRVRAGSLYPALAGRRTYVSSQIVLETHDLKLPEREQAARDVLHDTRLDIAFGLARDLGVDYVVLDDWDLMHENWEMPIASREAVWRSEAGAIIPINP